MIAEDLTNGILKPRKATVSREYLSFEQAVPYFLKLINLVEGANEYFEPYRQMALSFSTGEENEETP